MTSLMSLEALEASAPSREATLVRIAWGNLETAYYIQTALTEVRRYGLRKVFSLGLFAPWVKNSFLCSF